MVQHFQKSARTSSCKFVLQLSVDEMPYKQTLGTERGKFDFCAPTSTTFFPNHKIDKLLEMPMTNAQPVFESFPVFDLVHLHVTESICSFDNTF